MSIDSFLMYSVIGVGVALLTLGPLFFFVASRKVEMLDEQSKMAELFFKISKTVRSCGTFQELTTVHNWIRKIEYQLPPWAIKVLDKEWAEQETKLEERMAIVHGERGGKIQ